MLCIRWSPATDGHWCESIPARGGSSAAGRTQALCDVTRDSEERE